MKRDLLATLTTIAGLCVGALPAAAQSFTNGLVAYYPFNGNANDESGNGNNGIPSNAALTEDRFGISGQAYQFNGTNSQIQVPDNNTLDLANAYTLSAWFFSDNYASGQYMSILSKARPCYGYGYGLDVTPTGQAMTGLDNGETLSTPGHWLEVDSTDSLGSQKWHHVVATFDGVNVLLFVDGRQSASGIWTWGPLLDSTYPLYIGKIVNEGNKYLYDGAIDDVRIYNRALTEDEVANLYAYEIAPPVIVENPLPSWVLLGQSVNLSVSADGAAPLSYQWLKDGDPLAEVNSANLIITNAQLTNSGFYSVVITNAYGAVTSTGSFVLNS